MKLPKLPIGVSIALTFLAACSPPNGNDQAASLPGHSINDVQNNIVLRDAVYPGGAMDMDCTHTGDGLGGPGYQFIVSCDGRAVSPDGSWAVVQDPRSLDTNLVNRQGRVSDQIPSSPEAMPFVLMWSPNSTWFLINEYLGSASERLHVFTIVDGKAVERSGIYDDAARIAVQRYPCLGRGAEIFASGWRWSRDGRRVAMTVYARTDACFVETKPMVWEPDGNWEVLWMIGDVASGRIIPDSVRVRPSGVGPMPTEGPYAHL